MKRTTKIALTAALVIVGVLVLGVATTYAQGPGGRGSNGAGWNQGMQAGSSGQYGANAGALNSNQQGGLLLHQDPATGTLADGLTGMQSQFGRSNNGQGQRYQSQSGTGLYLDSVPVDGELPADVVAALEAGLQDEYTAYAIYETIIEQFGPVAPFVSIQRAEANHAAALERAFERYGLDIPAPQPLDETISFASLSEACAAGAAAEIANFELYDAWLATVSDYPDLVNIFTALRNASEFSHLPAFETCAG